MSNLTAIDPSVISVQDNQLTTTSNNVANIFGKQHQHVTQKIEKLECSPEFISSNFSLYVENTRVGAVSRDLKSYNMTKDGFMFLVMSFTGKKAAQIKEAYINAFNAMSEKLAKPIQPQLPIRETITPAQQCHLKSRISEVVHAFGDTNYQIQWAKLNNYMNVAKYSDILASDYTKACRFLNCAPKAENLPLSDVSAPTLPVTPKITTERVIALVKDREFLNDEQLYDLAEFFNAKLIQQSKDLSGCIRLMRAH